MVIRGKALRFFRIGHWVPGAGGGMVHNHVPCGGPGPQGLAGQGQHVGVAHIQSSMGIHMFMMFAFEMAPRGCGVPHDPPKDAAKGDSRGRRTSAQSRDVFLCSGSPVPSAQVGALG